MVYEFTKYPDETLLVFSNVLEKGEKDNDRFYKCHRRI